MEHETHEKYDHEMRKLQEHDDDTKRALINKERKDRENAAAEYITQEGIAGLFFSPAAVNNIAKVISDRIVNSEQITYIRKNNATASPSTLPLYYNYSVSFPTDGELVLMYASLFVPSGNAFAMINGSLIISGNFSGKLTIKIPKNTLIDIYTDSSSTIANFFASAFII